MAVVGLRARSFLGFMSSSNSKGNAKSLDSTVHSTVFSLSESIDYDDSESRQRRHTGVDSAALLSNSLSDSSSSGAEAETLARATHYINRRTRSSSRALLGEAEVEAMGLAIGELEEPSVNRLEDRFASSFNECSPETLASLRLKRAETAPIVIEEREEGEDTVGFFFDEAFQTDSTLKTNLHVVDVRRRVSLVGDPSEVYFHAQHIGSLRP